MDLAPVKDLFANPIAGIDPALVFWQAVIASILSTVLGLLISYTYKHTHRGSNYSQNFGQVLIIMAVVVGLIMIIIGSNIARAFSLVGALSIVRYRTAVKDARDTMFVFFAMMVGMAAGVGLRSIAIYATFFICGLIYVLYRMNFGFLTGSPSILKVMVPMWMSVEEAIEPYLRDRTERMSLISTETVREGTALEVTYRLVLKHDTVPTQLIEELKKRNGNDRVALYPGLVATDEG